MTPQQLKAMKLALEALKTSMYPQQKQLQAITAIKEALAQPEQYTTDAMKVRQAVAQALHDDVYAEELEQPEAKQSGTISITMTEPVAYLCENAVGHKYFRWKKPSSTYKPIPLYTTPPQRKEPEQEPVSLRRGDILRCIETDELCTVWSTSTTGKTLIKWSANNFGAYTAEQIGELFWLEPEPDDLELAAEKSDNYAAFHAGYRFAVARGNTGDNT